MSAMEMRLQLRLSQQLVMTPQLQMAIRLLQLNRLELAELVREEMLENPLLDDDGDPASDSAEPAQIGSDADAAAKVDSAAGEIDWESYLDHYSAGSPMAAFRPDRDDLPSLEATLTRATSLFEHLDEQLRLCDLTEEQRRVGRLILGNVDGDGYIKHPPLAEIAAEAGVALELADDVLMIVQGFDPIGVGARSLAECLLIQAIRCGQDDDILVKLLKDHIPDLAKKNYTVIARALGHPLEEIYEAVKVLVSFNPRPGREYSADEPRYITPDVYVHKVGDRYFVVPNDDGLPKLKISGFYRSALSGNAESKQYVQDKLRSAQWLIRSIQQRQRTIVKVTESILKFQRDFFERGVAHLRPLILRDVAEDISMHESTISRVTTNKYVHTPQGIYELKFFFNAGIHRTNGEDLASRAVKLKIKEMISGEPASRPFSDQKIVGMLHDIGIEIARRTVAKYRDQLGILSSSKRKQVF
jgi:RNA polymerase sigma-54 factor